MRQSAFAKGLTCSESRHWECSPESAAADCATCCSTGLRIQSRHWPNITVALIAIAIATPFARIMLRMNTLVLVLDAIGMGFFATSGAAIAADEGASWFAAGLIGMLTAIAGDVVAREVPLVMGPDDLYAIPAMLGAATYVAIDYFGPQWIGVAVGSAVATVLRLAALAFHWRLPTGPRELITPYD